MNTDIFQLLLNGGWVIAAFITSPRMSGRRIVPVGRLAGAAAM